MDDLQLDIFDDKAPIDQQEDESDLPKDKMGDPSESVLFNVDWTVSTIVQQIERGNIQLDPDFQRRAAWDPRRRSFLIESLIVGLPIPNIVLAESKENRGQFLVIDGKQRLNTIFDFMSEKSEHPLRLSGLTIRDDLNGKFFKDISKRSPRDATFIENAPIRTVVIRNWPSEYFLYVIFDRLNSGSLPLSPQELRRALQPGPLLNKIDEFIDASEALRAILGLSRPDRRMRDSELVLRYIAFERGAVHYRGDFKAFLDEPVRYFNSQWPAGEDELRGLLGSLDLALECSRQIFGEDAFKKWNGDRFEKRINRAIFDPIVRYFSDEGVRQKSLENAADVAEALKIICVQDNDFKRAVELTTKTPQAVHTRLGHWGNTLAEIIGGRFDGNAYRITA